MLLQLGRGILSADGTVVATKYSGQQEYDYGQCDVSGWEDVVCIGCGPAQTYGLLANGNVVATGYNEFGECEVNSWKDIKLPNT